MKLTSLVSLLGLIAALSFSFARAEEVVPRDDGPIAWKFKRTPVPEILCNSIQPPQDTISYSNLRGGIWFGGSSIDRYSVVTNVLSNFSQVNDHTRRIWRNLSSLSSGIRVKFISQNEVTEHSATPCWDMINGVLEVPAKGIPDSLFAALVYRELGRQFLSEDESYKLANDILDAAHCDYRKLLRQVVAKYDAESPNETIRRISPADKETIFFKFDYPIPNDDEPLARAFGQLVYQGLAEEWYSKHKKEVVSASQ